MKSIQAAVTALDPDLPVRDLLTAGQWVIRVTSQMFTIQQLLVGFALLGVFLAALGIYGVIARAVAQRTGEIGIRMALGAQISDVTRMVLGSGVRLALIGAGIGLLGSIGLSRLLTSTLPNLHAHGGLVLASAAGMLVLIALGACYLPARRAARIDPIIALRSE
jgi:ABC-type antimicrobial peptide transport system permease subunit